MIAPPVAPTVGPGDRPLVPMRPVAGPLHHLRRAVDDDARSGPV